jgi:RNA polymerase sigma factor (sigma-70 family)
MKRILQHLRRLTLVHNAGVSDGELVERFARQDEAAFEALLRRHGAMVLGVCRRVLGNHHDAEDAFQATFLVLVRKAHAVTPKESVASWLYGVAYRTALKAKDRAAKSRARERIAGASEMNEAPSEVAGELQAVLDQELGRLSEKYRSAFVLCSLEGKTHHEAARQLGCPEGTLSVRLMRAKQLLAKRLSGRGFGPATALLPLLAATDTASASVPPALAAATTKAALAMASGQAMAGLVSAEAALLMQGVLQAMLVTRLKIALIIVLIAGIVGLGVRPVVALLRAGGAGANAAATDPPAQAKEERAVDQQSDWDRIQGTWQVTKLESGGKLAPDDVVKKAQFIFQGKELTILPERSETAAFTLYPDRTPKAIDLVALDGPVKGKTRLGIYRFEGDALILCLGKERPTEFSGAGQAGLMHFKREAEGKKALVDWGSTNQGLRMSVSATGRGKVGNPELQVAFENVGEQDVSLNLGIMLANGKPLNGGRALFPTNIRVNLTDAQGNTRELHSPMPGVAGRVDDFVAPLRVGSVYTLRLPLSQFWSPKTGEFALDLKPGNYHVWAQFEGVGSRVDSSKFIGNFWEGKLRSNTLTLEQ